MHCGQHVIALFVVDTLFGNQLARYEVSHELSHTVIKLKFPCVDVSEILGCRGQATSPHLASAIAKGNKVVNSRLVVVIYRTRKLPIFVFVSSCEKELR